ncbi:MAG: L,D-transpeptidase [Lachnospiraceae bacterium]|nr:L,D-transpeptidase [Lachnospiraceae bacterium]
MKYGKYLALLGTAALSAGMLWQTGIHASARSSYTIYVNRKTNIVNVVNNRGSKLVRSMYCSTGKHYGTIKGTYRTKAKYRWRALFGGVYGQYATRIQGPYLFHSVPYKSRRASKVDTRDYNRLGKQDSMGCIRMAVVDVKWIYDNCPIGTKVVINDSRRMVKPTRKKLKISGSRRTGWDPTDPNRSNPYRPKVKVKASYRKGIPVGTPLDVKSAISLKSKFSSQQELLDHTVIKGKVDTSKAGTYRVKIKVQDPNTLLTAKKTCSFIVR